MYRASSILHFIFIMYLERNSHPSHVTLLYESSEIQCQLLLVFGDIYGIME